MASISDYGKWFIILGILIFLISGLITLALTSLYLQTPSHDIEETFMLIGAGAITGVGGFFAFIGLIMFFLFRKKAAPPAPKQPMPKVPMPKQAAPKISMPKPAPPPAP